MHDASCLSRLHPIARLAEEKSDSEHRDSSPACQFAEPGPGRLTPVSQSGCWGSVGDSHSLWPGVHCSPLPSALRGPEHRSRRVPPTAHIRVGGGFWIFTSGGARAPCPDGGVPPGKSLDSTTTHSAGSGPRGRRPGPPASCARASPSLSPVGGPG